MTDPRSIKFLLVDDVEENLVALTALLKRDGLELLCARSGSEALELLLVHDFALALVDVQMPNMDGFELAELMRGAERSKHVPIIFLTAGAGEQQRIFRGYESGAVDFLFKPIDAEILKHKTAVFYQLYQHRQQLAQEAVERERLMREMQETLRLNEMLMAVLGHDLRTPLGAIMTGAALLIQRSPEDTIPKRILSSGSRMAHMIEQLLDLARARLGGGIQVSPSEVDLSTLTECVVAEHQGLHPTRRITLEAKERVRGYWDETRLSQVVSNLVANAIKHGSKTGNVGVRLSQDNGQAVIEVSNEGAIDPSIIPYLFDPFRSARAAHKRTEGLGLGLYIVDQLVRAHRGTVQVRSTQEQGTTFEVRLPQAKVEAEPASRPTKSA